jgi:hypothetical protein
MVSIPASPLTERCCRPERASQPAGRCLAGQHIQHRHASFAALSLSSERSQRAVRLRLQAQKTDEEVAQGADGKPKLDPEAVTKKWGLEAGLFNIFTSKEEAGQTGQSKGQQAKQLLKRYGSAYLITSISFAIVSFAACYALVSSGVDVPALCSRFGIEVGNTGERVGTFAIAYAAHKALSPVRFPPTVALTPVVARILGKEGGDKEQPKA